MKTLINSNTYVQSFGKITVLAEFKDTSKRNRMVFCACSCGNFLYTAKSKVLRGHTRSCGCLNIQKYENLGNSRRLKDCDAAINALILSYKTSARSRGIVFDISRDEFVKITSSSCHYCGKLPSRLSKAKHNSSPTYVCNGIDRVDNNRGYAENNIVPCCKTCNVIKSDRSLEFMYEHILKIIGNIGCQDKTTNTDY